MLLRVGSCCHAGSVSKPQIAFSTRCSSAEKPITENWELSALCGVQFSCRDWRFRLTQVLPNVFSWMGRFMVGRIEIQSSSCSAYKFDIYSNPCSAKTVDLRWFSLQNAMADAEGLRHVITLVECQWSAVSSHSVAVACAETQWTSTPPWQASPVRQCNKI